MEGCFTRISVVKDLWKQLGTNFLVNDTHRANCVLLNSIQEFINLEAWLLLTFSLCLHNLLILIYSIVACQMFEKCNSSNRQK